MRIFQYDEIVTPNILVALKNEVEIMNTLMDRNAWIGLHDQPDNAIEQFILAVSYTHLTLPTTYGV